MNLPNIKTSEIITFNTIALKGAIRDVCRALYRKDQGDDGEYLKIADAICAEVERDEDGMRKKYPEVFKYVDIVNGTIVSIGSHPSGVLVSDRDIERDVGLCSISTSDYPVSMLDMHGLDGQMYVKLDLLGLDNLGVINQTCELAGIDYLTPDNVDLDDEKVWRSIRDDTTLIFQWESDSAQAYLKKFMSDETIAKIKAKSPNFSYLKWFSFGNGLLRPACASYRDEVSGGDFYDNGFKELNEFLAPEAGRVCMQETIMLFLVKFCGYSQAESDTVRRCVDENTLILMGDGTYKKIKDIAIGDVVQSFDHFGASQPSLVSGKYDNGFSETLDITTQHGNKLTCTPSHKLLTQRGFVRADEITTDDFIMTPKNTRTIPDGLTSQKRLSEKIMYAIGLLIGDGSVGKDDTIHFTNHEMDLINKYKDCIESISVSGDCEFKIVHQDGIGVEKIYSIYISSKNYRESLSNLLNKLGLRKKSADKCIPDELMKYPFGGKIQNLLAGLFNTDGGYNLHQNYIDYSSKSKILTLQIKSLLMKCGIYSYVNEKYVKKYNYNMYRLIIQQPASLDLFRKYILPLIVGEKYEYFSSVIKNSTQNYKKFNFLLPNECKNEILQMSQNMGVSLRSVGARLGDSDFAIHQKEFGISDTKARHVVQKVFCPYTYKMLMSDYIPVRVKKITQGSLSHVYDIEVENNHNYVAENLIVHNCIAKKKGTETLLPEIEQRFIEYSSTHYDITKEKCQEVIKPFLQIILDASDYGLTTWSLI